MAKCIFKVILITDKNKPYNPQIERIIISFKPLIFNMLLEKENGKRYREEFIAKLGRKVGRILSGLPRGRPKKQKQE